jgi:hypothetical protein
MQSSDLALLLIGLSWVAFVAVVAVMVRNWRSKRDEAPAE